jgi:hypothetical protein
MKMYCSELLLIREAVEGNVSCGKTAGSGLTRPDILALSMGSELKWRYRFLPFDSEDKDLWGGCTGSGMRLL